MNWKGKSWYGEGLIYQHQIIFNLRTKILNIIKKNVCPSAKVNFPDTVVRLIKRSIEHSCGM